MLEEDTSFSGLLNYTAPARTTAASGRRSATPSCSSAIALPVELVLGLLLAFLFLDRMPGRQVFVALLVLPVVISPIIAGATWRLLFDNRFGPINQIIGWIAGQETTMLWTVNPTLRLPGDPDRRDLAVDAVHVPAAAGGPVQRRQVAARGRRDRRRRLLGHLPQDHPARDPARARDRRPDPGARPVPPVRRRLGADRGRARHDDRDGLDLRLRPGLPAVRDQLCRRHGRSPSCSIVNVLVILALRRVEIAR